MPNIKDLPAELVYALLFGAVLLFQYLMKRFAPKPQQEAPQDEPEPELEEADSPWVRPLPIATAPEVRFGRTQAPSAFTALPERRFSRKSLMGNRRDVQNAVVIAAILGPCRAFEPHGSGERK